MLNWHLKFGGWVVMRDAMFIFDTGLASAQSEAAMLAPGDFVKIIVFKNLDMTIKVRISETGSVNLLLLGAMTIRVLTAAQAEVRIVKVLREGGNIVNRRVNAHLLQARCRQMQALGQVGFTGRYPEDVPNCYMTRNVELDHGDMLYMQRSLVLSIHTRSGPPRCKPGRAKDDRMTGYGHVRCASVSVQRARHPDFPSRRFGQGAAGRCDQRPAEPIFSFDRLR